MVHDSSVLVPVVLEVEVSGEVRRVSVDAGEFLIGRAEFCDLQIDSPAVPLAWCVVHLQGQVVWIEAADEVATLEINGQAMKRLAVRSGDRLTLGPVTLTVRLGADALTKPAEDLSGLSAVELCERIEAEQQALDDHERQRILGVEALLAALEGVLTQESLTSDPTRTETVLGQLQGLSELLAERTRQLADHEQEFLASAVEIKQAQDRMTRRLEELLGHLEEGDLRASA